MDLDFCGSSEAGTRGSPLGFGSRFRERSERRDGYRGPG